MDDIILLRVLLLMMILGSPKDQRPRSRGGYLSLFYCSEGTSWPIHVSLPPPKGVHPMGFAPWTNFDDSKWFLEALGHEGLNNLLLAYEDKSAQAVCTFAYCEGPMQEPVIFEGRVLVRAFFLLLGVVLKRVLRGVRICMAKRLKRGRSYLLEDRRVSVCLLREAFSLVVALLMGNR